MTAEERATTRFRVLGPVEVVRNGTSVPLGGPRQRALLSLLLLRPGRPISADRLVDELWEGRSPAGASTTIRSYVSRLRRALGGEGEISGGSGSYALAVDPTRIDAARFEQLVRDGEEALRRGAARKARGRLEHALSLWTGAPFGGVGHVTALRLEAERLEELRLFALEQRFEADLALGRGAELVDELEGLAAQHPEREHLVANLMLALYRAGRQADALAAYQRARSYLDRELGLEPGEELRQLEQQILRHEVPEAKPPAERHNLPAPVTSFVGREQELQELGRLLREHRLLTLTGVGGVGKTRLALELARRELPDFAGGAYCADLAPLVDVALLEREVATVLALPEQSSAPIEQLLFARLRETEVLLVLDNCEHVREACAGLSQRLLTACPRLRMVATSREPLGVPGEVDYVVPPLGVPALDAEPDELRTSEAVLLFLARARAARPQLADDDRVLASAARICSDLDGLPLALELAAARAKALSFDDIAVRIRDRFRFLVSWRRLVPARHRTLLEAMDWSYELLVPAEQLLLTRLSVFAGSFTLEAAARVCLDEEEPRALELVERLVDASLVIAEARGSEMSYRLLETVRQYAEERLSKAGAREEFLRRHAEYFLRVAESASVAIDTSGPQRHELVLAEPHNLRAALNWATRADPELGLRLAAALHYFWMAHDPNEGIRRLEALLARAPSADPGLRARALLSFGACLSWAGEPDSARAAFAESRTLYQTLGDEWGLTECTFRLGFIDAQQDGREPRDLFEEALQEWRRLQHATGELRALADLGAWEFEHGDWARGKELTEESLSLARRVGSSWTEAAALGQLALRSLEVGRVEEGERWALDYLSLAREIASRTDLFLGLGMLAWAARERGDVERAVTLWAALESEETRAPVPLWPERRAIYETHIPLEPRPAAVLAFEDAVEYALSAAVR